METEDLSNFEQVGVKSMVNKKISVGGMTLLDLQSKR